MHTGIPTSTGIQLRGLNDCWNKIGVHGDSTCTQLREHSHCRNCPTYASAAVRLLDREIPKEYEVESFYGSVGDAHRAVQDEKPFLIFRVGPEWLALPCAVFVAITEIKAIHSIPHRRSRVVNGLANFRGELLICVALEEVLNIQNEKQQASPIAKRPRLLVVANEDGRRLGFSVDEVDGLYRFTSEDILDLPANQPRNPPPHAKGIFKHKAHSVGVLDPQLLLRDLERSLG